VESEDTAAKAELASGNTVFVQDQLASPGASMVSAQSGEETLVDENFLRSTAKEVLGASEPKAALQHEEKARTRRVAPLMAAVALAAMACLPTFAGTPWAKTLLYVTLGASITAMLWLWWLATQSKPVPVWKTSFARSTAFSVTCAATIYFGIFSPAPVVMTLAVVIFAQHQNVTLARGTYLASALTLAIVAFLDAFHIVADPGLIQADTLSGTQRLVGQFLVQFLVLAGYLLGRFTRRSSTEALAMTQKAMRELARREVIAREALEGARRAFNIGGVGRLSGSLFGSFRLAEVIGHGGMGEVYRAEHSTLATPAAVKVLHPHLCHDENLLQRFLREAQLSASLDSPYIVRVLDAGQVAQGQFIAMELLEGQDLATYLHLEGLLSLSELLELAQQVGEGLDAAAAADIVHRDIKPQNLFLVGIEAVDARAATEENPAPLHCKILDFGVARAMSGDVTLTQGTSVLGTPNYMAPEQAVGNMADHRADLHALVAVLYRACTGFVPFTGENAQAILYSVVHEMPAPPSERAGLPESLDLFFTKGFAKEPDDRYQSGQELCDALERACSNF
jgi:hypothetical protein